MFGKKTMACLALIVLLLTTSFAAFSMGGGADPAVPPSRGLQGHSETYNVSFNKPTFYDDYDPNYTDNVLENNTWDDIAFVVFLQDMNRVKIKENLGAQTTTADCGDIYQAVFVELDGKTIDTGTKQRILMEDFTATWCTYCTAVVGAMDRMDHDSNWFPEKYIGVEWHSGGGTYGVGTPGSVAVARRNSYNIGTGIPRYIIDGMDPWVGGNPSPNHTATETNIKNRINARVATAMISLEAKAGHDDTKAWVEFTFTVEDPDFDNIKVEANAILMQNAHPRRHGSNNNAYLGWIANDHKKFRVLEVEGTPPSISDISPSEGAVLSGDVEITFKATDPDAADDKITSKVEIKKRSASTWNTLSRTEGKLIWKTAEKSGATYIYPDGDYEIRITCTDYWEEVSSRMINVSVLNPDPPQIILLDDDITSQFRSGNVAQGVIEIFWAAADDEDDVEDLLVSLFYKRSTDPWTAIAEDLPNTGSFSWDTMDPRVPDNTKYRILAIVTDTDNMTSEAVTSFEFTINNPDPPTIELNSLNVEGLEISGTVYIRWTALDEEDAPQNLLINIYLSRNGGEDYEAYETGLANSGTKAFDTTKLPFGTNYRLRLRVIDTSGMFAEVETPIFAIYNNEAPIGSFLNPKQDDKVTGAVEIKWSASDREDDPSQLKVDLWYMSSISGYWTEIVVDYPNTGSYDWFTDELEDGDGTYTLKLIVKDTRGVSSPAYTIYFEVYNPKRPVISSPIMPNKVLSGSGTFTWIAEDPNPGETELLTVNILYSSDKVNWITLAEGVMNTGSFKWDVSNVPDGTYYLKIEVPDPVEEDLAAIHIFEGVVVDNPDPPTVEFTQVPAVGSNVSGEITFAWSGDDPDGDNLRYSLYYRKFGTGEWTLIASDIAGTSFAWNTSGLTTGDYEVRILARDDSSKGLESEQIYGPFQIYVRQVDSGGNGGGGGGTLQPEDEGDDTLLIVAVAVLLLLLLLIIVLVAAVLVKRNKEAAAAQLPPPGGLMAPMPPAPLPGTTQPKLPPTTTTSPGLPPKSDPPSPEQDTETGEEIVSGELPDAPNTGDEPPKAQI